jgi:type I restriction enzyme S subunit
MHKTKNTESLKPGWRRVKFGDVVQLSKARCADPLAEGVERYVGLEHLEPGDLRIRNWGNVADGVTFTSVFQPGQVLFGKRRAYQRKVAVADFSGVCSGDIYVMESKDANVLLPELLPFICQTDAFFEHAVGTSAGSLSPRTNWSSMADFEFVLPSVDDQRDFSQVFLNIENVLLELANAHEAATALFRATHAALYSEVLTSPNGTGIGEFFDSISDKGFTDLPILSVTIGGEIVRRDSLERHVSDETGDEKYIRVLPNDLVYNTMRLWQGAIGIVKEVGLISPAYTVLRLKDPSDTPLYWWYLFRSPTVINEYRRFVKGVAKDRWRIYFADLQRLSVLVPTDENRDAVAAKLDEVRNAIQGQLNRRSDLFNLRKQLVERSLGRSNV